MSTELDTAKAVVWIPRGGGAAVTLGEVSDLYLINIANACRRGKYGSNNPDLIIPAATLIANFRGISLEKPMITDPFRLAQIVQDLTMALREEGVTETSSAAQRAWSQYEREFKKNG